MAKVYAELDERLTKFIVTQPIFFVATAPCLAASGEGGHVNVSPKGYRDTFAILGPRTVAYLDLIGSGAETIAHLAERQTPEQLAAYQARLNAVSIDGLPALS
jgi:hypothetical protein